jgi:hypothetical protein
MTDKSVPSLPPGILTPEQIETISGGSCTVTDYVNALTELRTAYDNLVDFTSYVIERVSNR